MWGLSQWVSCGQRKQCRAEQAGWGWGVGLGHSSGCDELAGVVHRRGWRAVQVAGQARCRGGLGTQGSARGIRCYTDISHGLQTRSTALTPGCTRHTDHGGQSEVR